MQIVKNNLNQSIKLSIIGRVVSKDDEVQLLYELENIHFGNVEINFYDATTLSKKVIKVLYSLISNRVNLKINIFKYQLFSYFLLLNIQSHYIVLKSITKKEFKSFNILGIGGSADSLKKILEFISLLPKSKLSIFIVQHIREGTKNLLPKLIEKYSDKYIILEAEDGMEVMPSSIYIAPSSHHLTVKNGYIKLVDSEPINFARPSIDVMFDSLSNEYKNLFCAILLCGYGKDGYHSFSKIKANGGVVFIEEPSECQANSLLNSAILDGNYDYVMKIKDIAEIISEMIIDISEIDNNSLFLISFLETIKEIYGYDFTEYQLESIKRRLKLVMTKEHIKNIYTLKNEIVSNYTIFEKLFLEFSINVSTFFRNPNMFLELRKAIMLYLNSYSHLKIWSAGCSLGEEPYSIAIILYELNMLNKSLIHSTDINPFIIAQAENGLFPTKKLIEYENNYKNSGGEKNFKDYFEINSSYCEIKDFLKERILFFEHSLTNSGVFNEFQIIFCRNVLIYFNQELRERVLELFANSLDRNGFLVLGESENISSPRFEIINKDLKIYKLKN